MVAKTIKDEKIDVVWNYAKYNYRLL
jgi:hypothetical protein